MGTDYFYIGCALTIRIGTVIYLYVFTMFDFCFVISKRDIIVITDLI